MNYLLIALLVFKEIFSFKQLSGIIIGIVEIALIGGLIKI